MQNIKVSNAAYQKLMNYCKETGQSASAVISRVPDILRDLDALDKECRPGKAQLALLEEDCAKAVKNTKKPIPHEEVFKRAL